MALKKYDEKKHQFWFDLTGLINCVINENVLTPNSQRYKKVELSRSQDLKLWRLRK